MWLHVISYQCLDGLGHPTDSFSYSSHAHEHVHVQVQAPACCLPPLLNVMTMTAV